MVIHKSALCMHSLFYTDGLCVLRNRIVLVEATGIGDMSKETESETQFFPMRMCKLHYCGNVAILRKVVRNQSVKPGRTVHHSNELEPWMVLYNLQ